MQNHTFVTDPSPPRKSTKKDTKVFDLTKSIDFEFALEGKMASDKHVYKSMFCEYDMVNL